MTSDDRVRQLFSDEDETDTDTNQTGNGSTASFYSTDRQASCFETNRSVVSVEADVHRTPADNLEAKAVKTRKPKLRSDESSTSTDEGIYQELEDETDDSSARFLGVTAPPPPPPPPPPPGNPSSSSEMDEKTPQGANSSDNHSESETIESSMDEPTKFEPKKIYVTRQQLSFIPPQFDGPPEVDVNIKPSEYLKKLSPSNHKLLARAETCQEEPKNGIVRISCYTSDVSKRVVETVSSERQAVTVTTSLPPGVSLTPDLIQKVQLKKTEIPDSGQRNVVLKKNDVASEQKQQRDEEIRKSNERKTMDSTNEVKLTDEEVFSTDNFVEKMPAVDSNGCPIPLWKRKVMAKKAAEKAKKEAEDQRQKEAEEKWQQTVPAWKRQLLQRKEVSNKQQELRSGSMGTIVVTVNTNQRGSKAETLVIKETDKPPNPGLSKLNKPGAR